MVLSSHFSTSRVRAELRSFARSPGLTQRLEPKTSLVRIAFRATFSRIVTAHHQSSGFLPDLGRRYCKADNLPQAENDQYLREAAGRCRREADILELA
jgi:hypothetical protein